MKPIRLLAAICVVIILSSCGGMIRSYIRKDKDNAPADYGNSTILVIQHNKRYNKNVAASFTKYYKGDYLLVNPEDLGKYNDTEKYRYIFDNTIERTTYTGRIGSKPANTASMSFNVRDRKTDKVYPAEISSGAYTIILDAYVTKLETLRAKNAANSFTMSSTAR